jgi:oxygen-dependent protoporphyrinogen oxidase
LDLRSEVICTPRASPAGRNRFLHVPPTQGLQPLPSGLFSLFTLPLGRLVLRAVLAEPFVPPNHPQKNPPALSPSPSTPPPPPAPHETTETDPSGAAAAAAVVDGEDDDESVDSFFSRRFGDAFARTLGSALVHGIYAADSRVLSLRAAFPQLRASEARGNGSVIWGELGPAAWFGSKKTGVDDKSQEQVVEEGGDHEWEAQLGRTAALFSFREGMETLVRGLVEALRGFPNVALRSGVAVRGIEIDAAADDDDDDDDDRCSFQVRDF